MMNTFKGPRSESPNGHGEPSGGQGPRAKGIRGVGAGNTGEGNGIPGAKGVHCDPIHGEPLGPW